MPVFCWTSLTTSISQQTLLQKTWVKNKAKFKTCLEVDLGNTTWRQTWRV